MARWLYVIILALLSTLAVACGAAGAAHVAEARVVGLPPAEARATLIPAGVTGFEACPVTLPGEELFTPPPPYPPRAPYGERFWYGSEALWTSLPANGHWPQLARGDKVFWWRTGYDPSGEPQPQLWMTARRLDGDGVAREDPPATNAYHRDFHWAMLAGFQVPSTGCWEITGHYERDGREEALAFVVWVGK